MLKHHIQLETIYFDLVKLIAITFQCHTKNRRKNKHKVTITISPY